MFIERKPIAKMSLPEVRTRYPRVTAHLICESLGYATPDSAAFILEEAALGSPSGSEWIMACYSGDPRGAVQDAISHRHHHQGYMAEYRAARAIVRATNEGQDGPVFASWF